MLSRLASLAGWIPVGIVFGKIVACPVGVADGSMAPTLRGPEVDGKVAIGDGDIGDRRQRSSESSSESVASTFSSPSPAAADSRPLPRSLLSVARSGGDVVLVDKLAARTYSYKRGDVVLMR